MKYQDNNLPIEISTLYDFYDSKPFILFSGVRANKFGDLGVVADFKILNTLLSKS